MAATWPSIMPLGATTSAPAVGLRLRHLSVEVDGGVVVDVPVLVDEPAVAVVGVLVEAQVGHDHEVVAHVRAQVAQGHLHDALGVPRARALGVLAGGHAEEDHGRHAHVGQLVHLLAQRLAGVLEHARQRGDLVRVVDALAHEQGDDQVVDRQPGLGHQPAQGGRAPQAPQPALRKGHGVDATTRAPAVPHGPGRAEGAPPAGGAPRC